MRGIFSLQPLAAAAVSWTAAFCLSAAPTLQSAKVLQIQNQVVLKEDASVQRPAVVGDTVEGVRTLVTGQKSRAELLFNDNTVARLGANSSFSFNPNTRDINLQSGFLLLHTPKGNGGAKISTPSASAAVLGTTIMLSALPNGGMKLVVLEGTATLTVGGVTQQVGAGQLVFMSPQQMMSPPITIDLKQLMSSSGLVKEFKGSIGSEKQINQAIDQQTEQIADGELAGTGITIGGDENGLTIVDPSQLQAVLEELEILTDQTEETAETWFEDETTGTLKLDASDHIDYAQPAGTPTIHEGGAGGPIVNTGVRTGTTDTFNFDRVMFTGMPPSGSNEAGLTLVTYHADGASINYDTTWHSIFIKNFTSPDPGPTYPMVFESAKGGILVENAQVFTESNLTVRTAGAGDPIEVYGSTIDTQNGFGGSNDLVVDSGGSVFVSGSAFQTGGPGQYMAGAVDVQATQPDQVIFVDNGTIISAGTMASGPVNLATDNVTGAVLLENNTSIVTAMGSGSGAAVNVSGAFVDIADTQITTQAGSGTGGAVNLTADVLFVRDSVVNTAVGTGPAGAIQMTGTVIDLSGSKFIAGLTAGTAAPVNITADIINLDKVDIKGSVVTLGNAGMTASVNFIGTQNNIATSTGASGLVIQGTQTGTPNVTTLP